LIIPGLASSRSCEEGIERKLKPLLAGIQTDIFFFADLIFCLCFSFLVNFSAEDKNVETEISRFDLQLHFEIWNLEGWLIRSFKLPSSLYDACDIREPCGLCIFKDHPSLNPDLKYVLFASSLFLGCNLHGEIRSCKVFHEKMDTLE